MKIDETIGQDMSKALVLIGQNIGRKRIIRGLSKAELARRAGNMKPQSLSAYENGKFAIPLDKLLAISHTLDFPVHSFFMDEEANKISFASNKEEVKAIHLIKNYLKLEPKWRNSFSKLFASAPKRKN